MEAVGVEPVAREGGPDGFDQGWRSGGVDIERGEVGVVGQHGFVHPTVPVMVFRAGCRRLRQNGGEAQPRVAAGPVEHQRFFVQVGGLAGAPVKVDIPRVLCLALEDMAEHRLERSESCAAGDHEHGTGASAVGELPDRAFDPQ